MMNFINIAFMKLNKDQGLIVGFNYDTDLNYSKDMQLYLDFSCLFDELQSSL
jgi:hypothetical protein